MKPMLAIGFMTLSLLAVTHGAPPLLALLPVAQSGRGMAAIIALCGVAVGASAYALALLRMGAVTAAELAQLPKLRGKPLALLRRLRLLR
ncbi:Uncharacterised protein [Mycobacterium tuberculosis]|nr:Uncharacterised protein [Mycobacterium tuberculosis]